MLYDDTKIEVAFMSVGVSNSAAEGYDYALEIALHIRDDYEAALAAQAAELRQAQLAVRELAELAVRLRAAGAAGTWQPVTDENTELIDPSADDDRRLYINDDGAGVEFTCDSGELEGHFNLPADYAVCRQVQP